MRINFLFFIVIDKVNMGFLLKEFLMLILAMQRDHILCYEAQYI